MNYWATLTRCDNSEIIYLTKQIYTFGRSEGFFS